MTAPTSAVAGVTFRANPQGFRELMLATKDFDRQLATRIRKGIRDAGKQVVGKVATEIRAGSYAADTGLREGIASGLRLQISTSTRQPGVRIVATGSALPDGKKGMANTWESKTFKHRVFGRDAWVEQAGDPKFFRTIYDNRGTVTTAVTKAMQDAATELGAHVR